jgi:hypothetical protein
MLAVLRFVSISEWKMHKKNRLWKSRACVPLSGFMIVHISSALYIIQLYNKLTEAPVWYNDFTNGIPTGYTVPQIRIVLFRY